MKVTDINTRNVAVGNGWRLFGESAALLVAAGIIQQVYNAVLNLRHSALQKGLSSVNQRAFLFEKPLSDPDK